MAKVAVSFEMTKDEFCWQCHKHQTDSSTINCSKCIRCFHIQCLSVDVSNPTSWICSECDEHEKDNRLVDKKTYERLINRITKDDDYRRFEAPLDASFNPSRYKQLINVICLNGIKLKIAQGKYKNPSGFLADIKWVHHNCCIYYKEMKKYVQVTKNLVEMCEDEIKSIDTCKECFVSDSNGGTSFSMICSKPHLVLLTRMDGYPHWPAKLMYVNGDHALVRFFGDHTSYKSPINRCWLYTRSIPGFDGKISQSTMDSFIEAQREVDAYIANLTEKFGGYVYSQQKVQFDPSKFNEYLNILMHPLKSSAASIPKVTQMPSEVPSAITKPVPDSFSVPRPVTFVRPSPKSVKLAAPMKVISPGKSKIIGSIVTKNMPARRQSIQIKRNSILNIDKKKGGLNKRRNSVHCLVSDPKIVYDTARVSLNRVNPTQKHPSAVLEVSTESKPIEIVDSDPELVHYVSDVEGGPIRESIKLAEIELKHAAELAALHKKISDDKMKHLNELNALRAKYDGANRCSDCKKLRKHL